MQGNTQANMICMIWMMLCTNVKRERVRETMDQTQTQRYVSRFEPLALHPRLHHRVGFPIHYLPPREPSPRRICYNTRSTELLSQTNTSSHKRGRPLAKQQPIHLTLEGYKPTTNSTSPRGSKHQSPPLPKREQTNHLKSITSTSTKEGATK